MILVPKPGRMQAVLSVVQSPLMAVAFLWLTAAGAAAQTLAVAAASDLQSALPAIARQFE